MPTLLPAGAPADLVERLAREGLYVPRRGGHLRVTPHVFNDLEDVERPVATLDRHLAARVD